MSDELDGFKARVRPKVTGRGQDYPLVDPPSLEASEIVKEGYTTAAKEYQALQRSKGLAAWSRTAPTDRLREIREREREAVRAKIPEFKFPEKNMKQPAAPPPLEASLCVIHPTNIPYTHSSKTRPRSTAHLEDSEDQQKLLDKFSQHQITFQGTFVGWNRVLNDWLLLRMHKEIEDKFNDDPEKLYEAIYYHFPNKLDLGELKNHIIYLKNKENPIPALPSVGEKPSLMKLCGVCMMRYNIWHNAFKLLGMKALQHQAIANVCNHPGQPCAKGSCKCLEAGYCTKYCNCGGPGCRYKFPGCQCTGACEGAACACFVSEFECDPYLCKNCCVAEPIPKKKCRNVQLQRRYCARVEVRLSKIPNAGCGLFVLDAVKQGQLICEYAGEITDALEAEIRGSFYDTVRRSYLYSLGNGKDIDPFYIGTPVRYPNHSKTNPNCAWKKMMVGIDLRAGFYAVRDIAAGEELFVDYGYNELASKRFDDPPPQTKKKGAPSK
ncbi:unnamed protein product, partial [Mesorhabditis spiculigera]